MRINPMIFLAHRQSDLHMFVIIVFPVKSNGQPCTPPYALCKRYVVKLMLDLSIRLDGVVGYHVGLITTI